MTREQFLRAYRAALIDRFAWAQDEAKLDRYMNSVEQTIGPSTFNTWHCDGETLTSVWREIGFTGKPTLKALRQLPSGGK